MSHHMDDDLVNLTYDALQIDGLKKDHNKVQRRSVRPRSLIITISTSSLRC